MTIEELSSLVEMRLLSFGYTVTEADQKILTYVTGQAAQYVCTFCNFPRCPEDIPSGLQYVTADYAAGDFLQHKKTFAPDELMNLDLDFAVKQISTGDTTTSFATGEGSETDEQKLNSFISYLKSYGKAQLTRFRRVKW